MLEVKNLVKIYKTKGGVETKALDDVSVNFPETGLVFLLGKSGSGKSTLLNMIGGLDRPDKGEIIVKGRSSKDFSQADFDSYRNTYVGFIFQEYNVLNEFNIEQNISLALQLQGKKNDKSAVDALLKEVDLEGFNKRKPNTLSGGQKQRIAIARALIKQPEIIMADEPTGALDSTTGKQVLDTLKKLSKTKLVVIVSHDQDFAEEYGDRIIELKDGKIISDKSKEYVAPKAVNEKMTIINGNIIDIKKGSALTEADFKTLYQLIKKQDKEILISTGEDNIATSKKAMRISNDGNGERFAPTKEVAVKKYDGKNTKFIRSRMPFARSFKMGASGLKSKPFRLIFTILLSVVSFTMFGVSSALMMYSPSKSIASGLAQEARRSEAVAKKYNYLRSYKTIRNRTGEVTEEGRSYEETSYTFFGIDEVKNLNAANNNKFAGVYNLSYQQISSQATMVFSEIAITSKDSTPSYDYYYGFNGFYGLSDADESFFTSNNYRLEAGTHPTNIDDIAISNYTYDLIKTSGFYTLNSYSDIIGKALKVNIQTYKGSFPITFKISGVYNFGELDSSYNKLKEAKPETQSDFDREKEVNKFRSYINNSLYTVGYVAPSFYETYGFVPNNGDKNVNTYWFKGIDFAENRSDLEERTVSSDEERPYYVYEKVGDGLTYFDNSFLPLSAKPELSDSEILLPIAGYKSGYEYEKYNNSLNRIFEKAQNYNGADFAEAKLELQNVRNDVTFEPTLDIAKTYKRVTDAFRNKTGSTIVYPSGYDIDEDFDSLKTYFENIYLKYTKQTILQNTYMAMNNYFNDYSHSGSTPTDWSQVQALGDRIYSEEEKLSEEEFTTLYTKIKADITTETAYCIKTGLAQSLQGVVIDHYRQLIENKINELGLKNLDDLSWEVRNTFGEDTDALDRLTLGLDECYKVVYNATPDVSELNVTLLPYKDYSDFTLPTKFYSKDAGGTIKEYTVKGFFSDGNDWSGNYVLTQNNLKDYYAEEYSYINVNTSNYVQPSDAKYAYLLAATDYNANDIALFTSSNSDGSFYDMTNSTYLEIKTWTDMISQMKTIFLIVGAVTGALSALLLLNFISVSISSKNKDIGILRAVGARGTDVFKIFFSESSVIAIICFVLSAIAGGVVCFYMNNSIKAKLDITLLNYGPINILLILAVTLLISFIATIIPVSIASKKPPVEAIRSL
ncbi:MAG: ATP-binding cassette domain-containing protein [Bacilli bacterium]|nr:ATP-binding cassette domain-containing protein [Bacilli bacterium]